MKIKIKFNFVILSALVWLLVEFYGRINGFYETFAYFDVLSHALFGFFLAVFIIYNKYKHPFFIVLLVSLAWEFLEIFGDSIIPQPAYMLDGFFWDGLGDIATHLFLMYIVKRKFR